MRINPGSVSLNKSTRTTSNNQALVGNKGASLEKNQQSRRAKATADSRSPIIAREDLLSLAADLQNGLIDREEASNRFIGTVVNNSIKEHLSEKDKKKLVDDIAEFFSEDPDFLKSLEKNLKDLA